MSHRLLSQRLSTISLLVMLALLAGCAHDLHVQRGKVFAQPAEARPLKMNLYMPEAPAQGPRPGMVMVHGGGWIMGKRTQQAWFARQFAREGYVVLTCDYRMMPRHPFPACVEDAKAAVRWMRANAQELQVAPDKIVAFGASAGGHIAAMLAATRPEDGFEGTENPGVPSEVAAAVILYGAVDLTVYRDSAANRFIGAFTGKNFKEDHARFTDGYEWASPISYVHPGMPPVHLTHGTKDALVPHVQSVRFHEKLQEAGVQTELKLWENRNHGFDYMWPEERRQIFQDMKVWLERVL